MLSNSLRRKVQKGKEEMEEFIASGRTLLETNASTVEEIGQMRTEAKKVMTDFGGKMSNMRRQSAELGKLLKQSGGSSSGRDVQPGALIGRQGLTTIP